jgi:Tfp pilus assembly protein PilX
MSRLRRDDDGGVLVLAVVFVFVVGLLGGAIATFASASLAQTTSLGNGATQEYAAEGAIQVAIQRVRNLNTTSTAPGYSGIACPTTSVTIPATTGAVSESLTVVCVVGQASVPFERKIVFAACPSGTTDANCLSGQSTFTPKPQSATLVVATTLFYDLPNGCTTVGSGCDLTPATSVDVSAWDASHVTG